ncbi:hypothetical protein XENTR_v10003091 [Xenopus tropicalis]|nr:hypothetical protein XENTR_v10003091 [Xenopus tropicalis]
MVSARPQPMNFHTSTYTNLQLWVRSSGDFARKIKRGKGAVADH